MRRAFALCLPALLVAGCHTPSRAAPAGAVAPTNTRSTPALLADARPQSPGPNPAGAKPDAETLALVADTLSRVAAARALPALGPVASRTLDRSALIAQVRAHAEREVPREALRAQGELLRAFGLLPLTYDFEQGVFDLLESQLAGYYEPSDKTMYLASDLDEGGAEATLAHELVHALQDQHYEIGAKLAFHEDNGDASSAIQCLAEGDATSAMIDVMLKGQATALSLPERLLELQMQGSTMVMSTAKPTPSVLKASLVAPYLDGMRFVNRLRKRGGWAAVDSAWKRPPATTEQVLHLDKYDANEPALTMPPPPSDAPGGGYTVVFSDLVGEQGLRLVFEEWGSHGQAEAAAAGWGGDRIALLSRERDGEREQLVVWRVRFDGAGASCADAAEAFRLVAHAAAPSAKATGQTPMVCTDRPGLGPFVVARSSCDVLLIGGPYARHGNEAPRAAGDCKTMQAWATKLLGGGR